MSWHRKAGKPVSVWIGILIAFSFVHFLVPDYRWILIHMFTLGVVTNAIMLWSQHFTEKFLHNKLPDSDRVWQLRRFWILNAGIVITIAGQVLGSWWSSHWIVTSLGAAVVGGSLAFHAFYLGRQFRAHSKGQRFAPSVAAYIASAACLPFGALFGAIASAPIDSDWETRLRVAHLAVNILGFVGFATIGSLVVLFAAVFRTQSGNVRIGSTISLMGIGVVASVAGGLLASNVIVGAGLVFYLAGLLMTSGSWIHSLRLVAADPRDRITFASASVAASLVWLFGSLAVLTARVFTVADFDAVRLPTMALLIGFAAQLLAGMMSYLLPSTIGGGPAATRTGMAIMNKAGLFRFGLVNLGLAIWLYTDNSWLRVGTSVLSMGAIAVIFFLIPMSAKAQVAVIRGNREPIALAPSPSWGQLTASVAVLSLLLASTGGLGATGTAGNTQLASSAQSESTATGETTEVSIEMKDMRFSPDAVSVPVGNQLRITLTNSDDQAHDLVLANGVSSGRIQPGETAIVEAGIITSDVEGWCSIAGHKIQGMVMHVRAEGATQDSSASENAHSSHSSMQASDSDSMALADPSDLNRDLFVDPVLAPAEESTTHAITIDISELDLPIANASDPNGAETIRGRWTFNGGVQGPALRGKIGDIFEVTLVNNGTIAHSIDFHAGMVSPDAVMRSINPGESLRYVFRAEHAGAWLYHCGTAPVSMHIASGMFGAVIIDPPALADVDHEYLLVQSEVYGLESTKEMPVDANLLAAGTPSATVFNGIENQYVAAPIEMKAGDTARFWLVNAGPNLSESFHIVGTQFHTTYKEGAYLLKDAQDGGGAQALDLLAAQGGFVEASFPEAGTYTMVNHQFIDAERGAKGKIVVN